LHPVLREYRAHLGVDYRAPAGSPVVAVADGLVVSAGDAGASGRMVHLRHANGFETEYLHLSSVAVRGGARVRQGDVVGRVGATGLATGPHLDYRVRRNGVFVNPVAAHRAMPPVDPIPVAQMEAFEAARDRAFASLTVSAIARVGNSDAPVK
jgi:murein DD-endopeptidase MepM/ murein hydrolase activator NlpD